MNHVLLNFDPGAAPLDIDKILPTGKFILTLYINHNSEPPFFFHYGFEHYSV